MDDFFLCVSDLKLLARDIPYDLRYGQSVDLCIYNRRGALGGHISDTQEHSLYVASARSGRARHCRLLIFLKNKMKDFRYPQTFTKFIAFTQ